MSALGGCAAPAEDEAPEAAASSSAPTPEDAPSAPAAVEQGPTVYAPSRPDCETVAVFARGVSAGSVCADEAASRNLTVIDLSDDWTPRVFTKSSQSQDAPEYRAKYLELAQQPNADLGLYGIAPTMTVLVRRLTDGGQRGCDVAVNVAPIAEVSAAVAAAPDARAAAATLKRASAKPVAGAIQSELVCAGLLKPRAATGAMNGSTQSALESFRRRHMIVGSGLDADTVHALALGGEELAFRGVLRGLRERVADAAALLEDGSASLQTAKVVGRELDLTHLPPLAEALENGAPDLVDQATDVAARELGWTTPEAVRAFSAARGPDGWKGLRVAVTLPVSPTYHSATMDLRVEIDRGDVFQTPAQARGKLDRRAPSFVVYAKSGEREVALMRWSTTIGGWKKERMEDGEIALKYKESDVGDRVWRRIIAAPAWMPPDSTPETDLLSEGKDGTYTLKRDLIMPGYRNAYGLVMLIHEEAIVRGAKTTWADHGIRTHGSVDYRSIRSGTSHGCHRLYNQLALRLSGFLLQHRASERRGKMAAGYHRTLQIDEQSVEVDIPTRGYLYELDPPIPVRVLEGRVVGEALSASAEPGKSDKSS